MPVEITIPRLGWSMDEGTFGEWVKTSGEFVAAGEPIFLLETEKALQEVESVDEGFLHIIDGGPREGETVKVGTVIGWLLEENESVPASVPAAPPPTATAQPVSRSTAGTRPPVQSARPAADRRSARGTSIASPSVRRLARQLHVDVASIDSDQAVSAGDVIRAASPARRVFRQAPSIPGSASALPRHFNESAPEISPRAARTARRLGIDWTQIQGSGAAGRIRESDVLTAGGISDMPTGNVVEATAARKMIADRMAQSRRITVPVTLTTTACVDDLVRDRGQRKAAGDDRPIPAIHDYVLRAVAAALTEFPALNSRWLNGEILQPDGIHLGLAVDTEHGLMVPVIDHADRNNLEEFAAASTALIAGARQRKLTETQMSGGTFTVTSLGSLGIDFFTPIINPGEGAILGIGAIRPQPGPSEDGVQWTQQMSLSLTFDHQVTDGAPAAQFLAAVAARLNRSESE